MGSLNRAVLRKFIFLSIPFEKCSPGHNACNISLVLLSFNGCCTYCCIHHLSVAADVILWKRQHVSCGIIVVATVAWLLFERAGLPFLTVCSNVLLILIVLLFLRANYTVLNNE